MQVGLCTEWFARSKHEKASHHNNSARRFELLANTGYRLLRNQYESIPQKYVGLSFYGWQTNVCKHTLNKKRSLAPWWKATASLPTHSPITLRSVHPALPFTKLIDCIFLSTRSLLPPLRNSDATHQGSAFEAKTFI